MENCYSLDTHKKNHGFTMIELLIVIAIIGILATALAPKLLKEIRKATVAKVQHNLGVIRSRLSLDETLLDVFPDLSGEDNADLLKAYSIETTPGFTDSNGITHGETSQVLSTRDNKGGWYYKRSTGDIYANLPNGAYTYDKVYEIWNEEIQSLIDSGAVDSDGKYINNSSFEKDTDKLKFTGNKNWNLFDQSEINSWKSETPGYEIEVWKDEMDSIGAADGEYFIELNSNKSGSLYQDIVTVPGTTLILSVDHRGRSGTDKASLTIGTSDSVPLLDMETDKGAWVTYTQEYIVPEGQTTTRFYLNSGSTANNSSTVGNLIDNFTVQVK